MKLRIPKREKLNRYNPKLVKVKEAFSAGSHQKVIILMSKILKNRLKSMIEFDFDFPDGYIANGEKFRSYTGYFKNGKSMKINFLLKESDYVHSFYICNKEGKVIEAYEFEFDTPIPQVLGTIVDYCKGDLEVEGDEAKEESTHTIKKIGKWLKEAAEEERAKIFQNWLLNSSDKNQHMQMITKDDPKKFYKNFVISMQKEFPDDFQNKYFPDSGVFVKLIRAYAKMNSIQNPHIRFRTVKRGQKPTELKPLILPEEQAFVPMVTGGAVAPAVIDWRNEFIKLQKNLDMLISEKKFAPYGLIIWGNGGTGKAQPLYSKVLTPNGFVTMKDIQVGDQVLTPSGEKANVLQIHPQEGLRPIYEVTFSDGSKTRCDENHLWKVWYQGNTNKTSVKSLKDIMRIGLKDSQERWQWSIPLVESPIEFGTSTQTPSFDAYTLGAFLGDGCFRGGYPTFTTMDSFIKDKINTSITKLDYIMSTIKEGLQYGIRGSIKCTRANPNFVTGKLRELGLWGLKSQDKFIPEVYKYSSIENRLSMLQGLMDTDGYVEESGYSEITLTSEKLVDDIRFIVKSLGGFASKKEREIKYDYKDGRPSSIAYRLSVVLPEEMNPFSLPRKKEKYENKSLFKRGLTIRNISFISNEEAKCITIDSPDQLYVTDDFIVTHNSFYINKVADKLGDKAVIKKGAFTWAGFVEILYQHRNLDLIVFDDADRVVTDADCRMMLKQALDDTVGEANDGIRKVNPPKLTAKMKSDWELNEDGTFNFGADIVIITNLDKVYDSALWSRMWKSPIFMTKREIIEKIEETSKEVIKAMGCTAEMGHMVANYISNLLESGAVTVNDDMMSYRVFKRGLQLIKHDPMGWMGSLNTEFGYGVRMTLKPDKTKKPEAPIAPIG